MLPGSIRATKGFTPSTLVPARWPWRHLGLAVLIAALLALGWNARHLLAWLATVADRASLVGRLEGLGWWGPLLFALLQVLQVLVAVIPGQALPVAAGYLYGFPAGAALTLATSVLASQIAFALARRAGRAAVGRRVPLERLDRYDRLAERYGLLFFALGFMLPLFPGDLLNLLAGLSGISSRRFLAANLVGHLPGSLLLTLLGSHGLSLPPLAWLALALSLLGLALSARGLKPGSQRG